MTEIIDENVSKSKGINIKELEDMLDTIDIDTITSDKLILFERIAGRADLPGYNADFDHKLAGVVGKLIVNGKFKPDEIHEIFCSAWPDHKA